MKLPPLGLIAVALTLPGAFSVHAQSVGQEPAPVDAEAREDSTAWSFWDEDVDDMSDEQVSMLVSYHYTNPRPDAVLDLLARICRMFEEMGQTPVFEAFVASVAVAHPRVIADWRDAFEHLEPEVQRQIFIGLWLASPELEGDPLDGLGDLVAPELQEQFEWFRAAPPQPRVPSVSNSPTMHDAMWAGFFAAGEPGYVRAIIEGLDSEDVLTQSMAKWSLTSNAFQHGPVMAECLDARDAATDEQLKAMLAEIVSDAQTRLDEEQSPGPDWSEIGE